MTPKRMRQRLTVRPRLMLPTYRVLLSLHLPTGAELAPFFTKIQNPMSESEKIKLYERAISRILEVAEENEARTKDKQNKSWEGFNEISETCYKAKAEVKKGVSNV